MDLKLALILVKYQVLMSVCVEIILAKDRFCTFVKTTPER